MAVTIQLWYAPTKYDEPVRAVISSKNKISITDNHFVYVDIETDSPLEGKWYLWLSDFRFSLIFVRYDHNKYYYALNLGDFFNHQDLLKFSHKFANKGLLTSFYKIFLNYYGECTVELEEASLEPRIDEIGSVNVESNKIENIAHLLEYLWKKNEYYWSSVSLTKINAADFPKDQENILWTLKKIENTLNVIVNNFIPHIHDPISKLTPEFLVEEYNDTTNATEESILWLLENPSALELTKSSRDSDLIFQNRHFKVQELLTQVLVKNTDVLENQVIHGFVLQLADFLANTRTLIQKVLKTLEPLSDFRTNIYKSYYTRLEASTAYLQLIINFIHSEINTHIPVSKIHLSGIENARFQSKQHYSDLFEEILSWFNRSEAIFSIDDLFSGAKDIAKLYEIFCLFRIIDTLVVELGLTLLSSDISSEKLLSDHDYLTPDQPSFNRLYTFTDSNGLLLKLHYETLPADITTVARGVSGDYKPDFTLEIITANSTSYYLIMDAKYKTVANIKGYDYQSLTLKYLHGLGNKKGGYFRAIGLMMLTPIIDSKVDYYQKRQFVSDIKSITLPLIGNIEVAIIDNNNKFLKDVITKAVQIAEMQDRDTLYTKT